MRIVVDEGVPRQLVAALQKAGFDASQFNKAWKGITNGKLIAAVEAGGFDVLVTNDKNMVSQQSLQGRSLAVVALPTNRRATSPGQHVVMDYDGSRRTHTVNADGEITVEDLPSVQPFSG